MEQVRWIDTVQGPPGVQLCGTHMLQTCPCEMAREMALYCKGLRRALIMRSMSWCHDRSEKTSAKSGIAP